MTYAFRAKYFSHAILSLTGEALVAAAVAACSFNHFLSIKIRLVLVLNACIQ